jgi:hypothetical protein
MFMLYHNNQLHLTHPMSTFVWAPLAMLLSVLTTAGTALLLETHQVKNIQLEKQPCTPTAGLLVVLGVPCSFDLG